MVRLSPEQRAVLLHAVFEYRHPEIAAIFGRATTTCAADVAAALPACAPGPPLRRANRASDRRGNRTSGRPMLVRPEHVPVLDRHPLRLPPSVKPPPTRPAGMRCMTAWSCGSCTRPHGSCSRAWWSSSHAWSRRWAWSASMYAIVSGTTARTGLDDLEREMVAPGVPVAPHAFGLVLRRADVRCDDRLAQRGGVRERSHGAAVGGGDRDDDQVGDLARFSSRSASRGTHRRLI